MRRCCVRVDTTMGDDMKSKIMKHWLNGRSLSWIAMRHNMTVMQVQRIIHDNWEVL